MEVSLALFIASFLVQQAARHRVAILIHKAILDAELAKQIMKKRNGVSLVEPYLQSEVLTFSHPGELWSLSCFLPFLPG